MRKILILAAAVFLIFGGFVHKAHAVVPFCPFCVPAGSGPVGFAGFSTASNIGAMAGAAFVVWVFPYLNTTGLKPYEDAFKVVDYDYPRTPPGYEHVVVEDGVRVGHSRIAPTPESLKYQYQDSTGVHDPILAR